MIRWLLFLSFLFLLLAMNRRRRKRSKYNKVPTPKQRVGTPPDVVQVKLPEISVVAEEVVETAEAEVERPPPQEITEEVIEGVCDMDAVPNKPPSPYMLQQTSPMSDLSLSPPPSFSRLPPDGHEFPTCYQEPGSHFSVGEPALIELELKPAPIEDTKPNSDTQDMIKPAVAEFKMETNTKMNGDLTKPAIKEADVKEQLKKPTPMKVDIQTIVTKPAPVEVKSESEETLLKSPPPLPTSVPPSLPAPEPEKKFLPSRQPEVEVRLRSTETTRPRPKSWRQDEKSEQSVRDKIAMFASQEDKVSPISASRRLGTTYRSSENIHVEVSQPHPRVLDKSAPWSSGTLPSKSAARQDFADYCASVEPRSLNARPESALHTRSYSMADVSPRRPLRHSIGSDMMDEKRRASLTALIEQRRRGMSKLRGLVIPEKAEIAPSSHAVFDLPEIKSRESLLTSKPALVTTRDDPRLSSNVSSSLSTTNLKSPPWKSEAPNNLPKYSPAFKRKGLTVVGTSSTENKPPPLPPSKPPRNPSTLPSFSYNEPPSKASHDRPQSDDSDNDSAVSSSRSSISHEFSPPHSPLPSHLPLRRTLSSETTSSTTSTLTSGSQASCSSNGGSSSSDSGRRVLKAQSVEAINRKNVLSSARYSSGRDLKVGSPLIERKLHDDDDSSDLDGSEASKDSTYYGSYPEDNPIRVAYDTVVVEEEFEEMSNGKDVLQLPVAAPRQNSELSSEPKWKEDEVVPIEPPVKTFVTKKPTNGVEVPNGVNGHEETKPSRVSSDNGTRDREPEVPTQRQTVKEDAVIPSRIPARSRRSVSVIDIRKAFEKAEIALNGSRPRSNGVVKSSHARVSSLDSTTSDDSCAVTPAQYGSSNNLQREQFGSITSLASSTSLISQQELQALIDEANQALEEQGPPNQEVLVVVLHRELAGGSIGITLAGGADYEAKEITVHKVLGGSAADRDGRIQKGDRILSINGKSMKGVTHRESLNILKAPRTEVILVISRSRADSVDGSSTINNNNNSNTSNNNRPPRIPEQMPEPTPAGGKAARGPPVTLTLLKEGAGLGFSLEGGKDSPLGDKPLVIKKLFIGGSADKSRLIRAGDELLKVNEEDVASMSRIEAWGLMKKLPDGPVSLTVRHQVENKLR